MAARSPNHHAVLGLPTVSLPRLRGAGTMHAQMQRKTAYWLRLLIINLALSGALVLLALAAMEGYLRATIPASSGGALFESTLETRRYKVMRPNARIIAWGSEFRTNRLGFRDDDGDVPPKAQGVRRIVVLGDSFTASAGVDYQNIYTSLLERSLRKQLSGAEVINLAVGGYNILQYELVLDEVALSLEPDLILVAVFPFNDLSNDTYQANYEDAAGLSKPSAPTPWYQELYVYRAYLGRIEARIRRMITSAPVPQITRTAQAGQAAPAASEELSAAEQNLAALRRIMDKATKRGVPAVIALLPNTDKVEIQRDDFAPFLSLCGEARWPCLDLLNRFASSGDDLPSLRLNPLDPHPNDRYHELAARYLQEFIAPALRTAPVVAPSQL